MNVEKLRAWWSHRQGLDGSVLGRSAAGVLERTGWARSVAGVGPVTHSRNSVDITGLARPVARLLSDTGKESNHLRYS